MNATACSRRMGAGSPISRTNRGGGKSTSGRLRRRRLRARQPTPLPSSGRCRHREASVRAGDPQRVVLFGSRAHGRGRPDSDLDLLIIEDSNLPRHRRAPRYLRALVGVFPAKDVIVWTPAEIAEWSGVPYAFISTILREG